MESNDFLTILCLAVTIGCVGLLFVTALAFVDYNSQIRDCKDYNTYGYITKIDGDYWDAFNGKEICLITMEDDTFLPLRDFKTMSIKDAKTR